MGSLETRNAVRKCMSWLVSSQSVRFIRPRLRHIALSVLLIVASACPCLPVNRFDMAAYTAYPPFAPFGKGLEKDAPGSTESIPARAFSGTPASLIFHPKTGEGAGYQALFFPKFEDENHNSTRWAGQVHALLIDSYGNLREDTNGNGQLDLIDDLIIVYNLPGNGTAEVLKYRDGNGDGILDATEANTPFETGTITGMSYLWNSSAWLNEIPDADVGTQRDYASSDRKRYIFTSIDANRDGLPDSSVDFVCPAEPAPTDLTDNTTIYPYLHTHQPFTSPTAAPLNISKANVSAFRCRQTRRVIEFIRGLDQGADAVGNPASTIPAFRSRQVDYKGRKGTPKTWRLGDIVNSTPTAVGRPSENYDLLYRDDSYTSYYVKYRERRTVVYVGANDGMLHAFNGGFFDRANSKFATKLDSAVEYDLGSELWAYIPFNLLPHLYWLTDPNYSHVYYVDLKPRVFDARIFDEANDPVHPNGWGTILVGGMRLGGGAINADVNKNDAPDAGDPTMRSAYFILDITNPEAPPRVLAEFSFSEQGFTTCYPTVAVTTQKDASGNITGQYWHLVFGSGPIDEDGPGSDALSHVTSNQTAKIFMVDLKQLTSASPSVSVVASDRQVKRASFTGNDYLVSLDDRSFISDLLAVDIDLNYNADVIYFGTIKGNLTDGWSGKLRRIVLDDGLPGRNKDKTLNTAHAIDPLSPSSWVTNSILIDLTGAHAGQPIAAAPSATKDDEGRVWVYFGTGRMFTRDDGTGERASDQQSFYGIKEPIDGSKKLTWATVPYSASNLLDVSSAVVYETGANVSGVGASNFGSLTALVGGKDGWFIDFSGKGERAMGQAIVFGDMVSFITCTPTMGSHALDGTSKLYTLFYKTGSAHKTSVVGLNNADQSNGNSEVKRSLDLGQGFSATPNLHTGKGDNSRTLVQQGTGGIQNTRQAHPGVVKSGLLSWKEE
jgi:type IV pilus assembly protein PilY1